MPIRIYLLVLVLITTVDESALAGMTRQLEVSTSLRQPVLLVALDARGDERITPEEYDAQPQKRPGDYDRLYGATVKIKCPFGWSSGNLVLKNDLIVTVAHAFQHDDPNDSEKCLPVARQELEQCYAQRGNSQPVYFDFSTLHHPMSGDCTGTKDSGNEVAWIRLKQNILGVTPYEISRQGAEAPASMVGIHFARAASFAARFKNHPRETQSFAEDTRLSQVKIYPKNYWYVTRGSMTEGNSGGADLVLNTATGRPQIFAVMSRGAGVTRDGTEYGQSNYNVHAAIQGQIAEMIRQEADRPYPYRDASASDAPDKPNYSADFKSSHSLGAWRLDASTITVRMSGQKTIFAYEKPDDDARRAGVVSGSILFEGALQDRRYSGLFHLFNSACSQNEVTAYGDIADNNGSVTFHFKRPIFDRNCYITKFENFITTVVLKD